MTTQLAASAPPSSPFLRAGVARLGDIVLSSDHKQRRCLTVLLLASLITAIAIGLMVWGTLLGMFRAREVAVLAVLSAGTMATFYVMIRSGWNQRCADPTLAFQQTIAAQTLVAGGYAVLGPVHSSALVLLALVMVFGMFNMRREAVRAVCVYTITAMGAVMAWRSQTDPHHYPVTQEWFNFILLATVLPAISQLSGQLMGMRVRLKTQKVALENALAHIQELATRDELTGLPNRRHMMNLLQEHALRRTRGGPAFYVGLVDLDHFKQINDSYGHAIGDETLRTFALQASAVLRATDAIGRWGGEEFLLILPGHGPGEAEIAVERLRSELAMAPACTAAPGLHVAFSAGLTRHRDGEAACHAIERADRALYEAKSAGRNRTTFI
jgi:diguanylate cyclase (GGDEF)-like protein